MTGESAAKWPTRDRALLLLALVADFLAFLVLATDPVPHVVGYLCMFGGAGLLSSLLIRHGMSDDEIRRLRR